MNSDDLKVLRVARVSEAHTHPTEGFTVVFIETTDGQSYALELEPLALGQLETKLKQVRDAQREDPESLDPPGPT